MAGKLDKTGYDKRNNKRNGFLYEMQFFTKALQKGLEVFLPTGDYLPQDCHVVNNDGQVYRVQIKGTATAVAEGTGRKIPRYRLSTGSGSKGKVAIKCNDVDIVAGYIAPIDQWYIIPCTELSGVTTWVYPNDPKTKSKIEKYRENWDVFAN